MNKFQIKVVRYKINIYQIFISNILETLNCQVLCQYYPNEQSNEAISKPTKEYPLKSETVIFEKDLIKFDNIDINEGLIYFFFVINKAILQESNVPTYNRLILKEVGFRIEPIELSFFVGNYTTFRISLKLTKQIETIEENKKNIEENSPLSLSQILDSNSKVSLKDKIKGFFVRNTKSNSDIQKPETLKDQNEEQNSSNSNNNNNNNNNTNNNNNYNTNDDGNLGGKRPKTIQFSKKVENNLKEKENVKKEEENEFKLKALKKLSVSLKPEASTDFELNEGIEDNEFYLKGVKYDQYLNKLEEEKKKEHEDSRESFCRGFFIASFPQKNGKVIENSQSFPAPCGHKECSSLPAMQPEIIARYPLQDTKKIELNNLAATICFPTGIKVCYSEENPPPLNDYVTPITTEKGERCYMVTYHFYHKIMNNIYNNSYEMHPLKHHLMKFGDSYLTLSEKEMDQKNVMGKIQESLNKSEEMGFRDYVYVPICICLISKYPYVNEMNKCLQSIYTLITKNLKDNDLELNNLIMHLIHSVPIPENDTKVFFYIPYFKNSIKLICPKMQDISVMNTNLSYLLKYFSIDYLMIILRLILFEQRVLFIDDDYTRLSLVIDNFLSLIYPFYWPHTNIPIMSDQMIQMLLSFIPYFNGIHSSFVPLVKKLFEENEIETEDELYMVYISQSKFKLGSSLINKNKKKYKYLQDHVPALPVDLEKELKKKLKRIKEDLDSYFKNNQKSKNLDLSDFDFRIRNSYIEMFVDMFHDYYKYMTFLDNDVVFNKSLFLEKITNINDKKFYTEFFETQLFQQFCQNIVKDELNYFTTKANNYDPNKKESSKTLLNLSLSKNFTFKRTITNRIKRDKIYIITPEYLKKKDEDMEKIEKKMEEKYKINKEKDEDDLNISKERILTEFTLIKNKNYIKSNCLIYTLPETQRANNKANFKGIVGGNLIFKLIQSMKLKSNRNFLPKDEYGITEKEKDNIKETIKDFTMNIFTSQEIKDDPNLKKDLQNTLNTPFGRQFFCGILSKNATNIILLKDNSFKLLGKLIYNSLLFILNIQENDKVLEQMVILVKSMKYFGNEVKGQTTTLWNDYKSKIQGYSKVNQSNFWEAWYRMEKRTPKLKIEEAILQLCDIMIELELDKSFIKTTLLGLAEKGFGKDSDNYRDISEKIPEILKKFTYSI